MDSQLENEELKTLASLILEERRQRKISSRNEKIGQVLSLLAGGSMLVTALALPGTARLFKGIWKDKSDWEDWKMFNLNYLNRTLRRLEKDKVVEIKDNGETGEVRLTEKGRQKVLKMGLETLTISKPDRWDGKWRMVFYDVFDKRKGSREKFRGYLKGAGFYPLQESVYLHAYPCEKEIEFLKYFLGMGGEVRIVIAERIENDQEFRDYFGV